ncbi:hypothetical protein [Streptomyces sp. NPDC054757]
MITPLIACARIARFGVNKGRSQPEWTVPVVTVAQHTFVEATPE